METHYILFIFLERNILYLPCHHHIYELSLKKCFGILKRFKQCWGNLNTEKLKPVTIN